MSAAHDTTLITNCPECRAVMWQGSTMCQRCRDAAEAGKKRLKGGLER